MHNYIEKSEKNCPECYQKIKGRSDKKFCSDQCRSNHYHKTHCINSASVKKINSILKKNRRILESLQLKNKINISKSALLSEGFNFSYFTHQGKKSQDSEPIFCYEFGYVDKDESHVVIFKEDE